MSKVIAVGFDNEKQAREADRVLREMHEEGPITLYNEAIVVKDANGQVAIREQPKARPLGAAGGSLVGGLIGVAGGPVGAAFGLGVGALTGAVVDATKNDVDRWFVWDVGARLEGGKVALVAEIDEDCERTLDRRMEAIAGAPLRRKRTLLGDGSFDELIEVSREELASLEAEDLANVQSSQTETTRKDTDRLQAKIDAARRKAWEKEKNLEAELELVQEEGRQKIAVLEAQKAQVSQESQALLERRLADVRSDYENRIQRINEALERRKSAAAPRAE